MVKYIPLATLDNIREHKPMNCNCLKRAAFKNIKQKTSVPVIFYTFLDKIDLIPRWENDMWDLDTSQADLSWENETWD